MLPKNDLGVDPGTTYENRTGITIKAKPDPVDFAALAEGIKADAFQGKRLLFSAAVCSMKVENRAALFMRVGGANGKMLAFDNMRNRPITGTSDWTRHAIVLDIADDAVDIIFGILLSLKGQVWMADVSLNPVGKEVPTTDMLKEIAPYFPVNLGFDE